MSIYTVRNLRKLAAQVVPDQQIGKINLGVSQYGAAVDETFEARIGWAKRFHLGGVTSVATINRTAGTASTTTAPTYQVESVPFTGTITAAGKLSLVFTSAQLAAWGTTSPYTLEVKTSSTSINTTVSECATAINADPVLAERFSASAPGSSLLITCKDPVPDAALNIELVPGTVVGLDAVATSTNSNAGTAGTLIVNPGAVDLLGAAFSANSTARFMRFACLRGAVSVQDTILPVGGVLEYDSTAAANPLPTSIPLETPFGDSILDVVYFSF